MRLATTSETQSLRVARQVIDACDAIAQFTETPGKLTRTYLSPPFHDVHEFLRTWMRRLGMTSHVDAAGNLRGVHSCRRSHPPRLLIGSHIDTVPDAGAYDGVLGVVIALALIENLAEALRMVHRGGRAIDPQLALEAWSEADPLNDRERQVLRLAGEGQSANDIATQLNLSHGTVRNYLSEAIGKLGTANRIVAYRLARQKGWL